MTLAGRIVGAGQAPYRRHPDDGTTTESLLTSAALAALADAGLRVADVDGLGVSSFTLAPDHAIDLAWRLGLRLGWLMQDPDGGASGVNLLQHAVRAVEAGDAAVILLVAGDRMTRETFPRLADTYNQFTAEYLAPLPFLGPNSLFAFLTQRHMEHHGLQRETYGAVAVSQRRWAQAHPNAAYRTPLTLAEYLEAPLVAPPLSRFDCVPVVSGADAIIVAGTGTGVGVRAMASAINADGQRGDGLRTGLAELSPELWARADLGPDDINLACVYDDYTAMVLIQLADLGLVRDDDLERFAHERLLRDGWPLNPCGGMLSAGQAGAAGGMLGLVEATRQLTGRAHGRQVSPARAAVVTGYGMVAARYGAFANAAVLTAPERGAPRALAAAPRLAAKPSPTPQARQAAHPDGSDAQIPLGECGACGQIAFPVPALCPACASRELRIVGADDGVLEQVTRRTDAAGEAVVLGEVRVLAAGGRPIEDGPIVVVRLDGEQALAWRGRRLRLSRRDGVNAAAPGQGL